MSCEERPRMLALSTLEEGRPGDDLNSLYNFLKRRNGERGTDFFSLRANSRMHENGTTLFQGRFKMNIKK